jgi:hypothetical protein
MKILATLSLQPDAPLEKVRPRLAEELRGSWALYAKDQLREVYATDRPTRVVFILEAASGSAAAALLAELPLVAAGLFQVDVIELHPFVNWSLLFSAPP